MRILPVDRLEKLRGDRYGQYSIRVNQQWRICFRWSAAGPEDIITQHALAVALHVPPRRINEIVHGKRRISADTALRLACYFGTSDRFWMNLQGRYDLEVERERLGSVLDKIHPRTSA